MALCYGRNGYTTSNVTEDRLRRRDQRQAGGGIRPDHPRSATPNVLRQLDSSDNHEAAHAVIGILTGSRVDYVRVADDLGRGPVGTDRLIPYYGAATVAFAPATVNSEHHVIMAASGAAAQLIWLAESGLWTGERQAAMEILAVHDPRAAQQALDTLGVTIAFSGPARLGEGWWWWYHEQATVMLGDRWPDVLAVAAALDDAGHLAGADVHDLVQRQGPGRASR